MNKNVLKSFAALMTMFLLVSAGTTKAQNDIITFDVGTFTVTLLTEAQQLGRTSILIGATEEMLKQTAPEGVFPNAVNTFLLETGGKTILFDTGLGIKLFDNLKAYGKKAADIDIIMLTHMHIDHIGGLLRDGEKNFPKVKLYIPRPEYDYWMSDEEMQKLPEASRGGFANARRVIAAYKDNISLFTPGDIDGTEELLPGIRGIAAYGHTPGHTGYLITSDASRLFIWGDLTHAMAVQMPYPQVSVAFDVVPEQAASSRMQLLDYLAANSIQIAGMHVEYPGLANIKTNQSGGYDFTLLCVCEGR